MVKCLLYVKEHYHGNMRTVQYLVPVSKTGHEICLLAVRVNIRLV